MSDTEDWLIGDTVYHRNRQDGDVGFAGQVCGYCPGRQWIKVMTPDSRKRIWLRINLVNIDLDMRKVASPKDADLREIAKGLVRKYGWVIHDPNGHKIEPDECAEARDA